MSEACVGAAGVQPSCFHGLCAVVPGGADPSAEALLTCRQMFVHLDACQLSALLKLQESWTFVGRLSGASQMIGERL